MTKQAWSIKDKFYSKKISLYQELRMTCLIGEPRKKGNCVCNTIKPGDRVVYVFVLIVFCYFLQLHCQHCPKVTSLWVCSVQHFLCTGTKWAVSSRQNEVSNQNPGFASYSPWALPVMYWKGFLKLTFLVFALHQSILLMKVWHSKRFLNFSQGSCIC